MMKKVTLIGMMLVFMSSVPAGFSSTAPALVDNSLSPHARVWSVGLGDVRWTDGFWARHFETARTQTIPEMWRIMSGTTHKHYLENFRIAAGLTKGRYRGAPIIGSQERLPC